MHFSHVTLGVVHYHYYTECVYGIGIGLAAVYRHNVSTDIKLLNFISSNFYKILIYCIVNN